MCGFAGVLSFSERYRLDGAGSARLGRALSDALAHRGPDGAGVWTSGIDGRDGPRPAGPRAPQVLLVHRRLAVIDPLPRSDQPFAQDGTVLLFNGEVFNFRELRSQLAPPEGGWRTEGDTEVLLAAYRQWGERCVDHIDGMYAFAAIDLRPREGPAVLLGRDPAGEKPLFVATIRDDRQRILALGFASELSALRLMPWFDFSLDGGAIHDYLAWGYIPGRRSVYAGVEKLLPGHVRVVGPEGERTRRYFDPGGRHKLEGDDRWASAVSLTRMLVRRAVEKRLVSDVPIGCLLSGGIDSSVVALCMSESLRRQGRPLRTFSVGFREAGYDESSHAARVAAHLGAEHHPMTLSPRAGSVAEDLPRIAAAFGEPFADSSALPTFYLAQLTRRHVTVALGGDGGDEVFGGYDRYRALQLGEVASRLPRSARGILAASARRLNSTPGPSRKTLPRLLRLLESIDQPVGTRYAGIMRLFPHHLLASLLPPGSVARPEPGRVAGLWFDAYLQGRDVVAAAAALDRVTYLPGDLLVKLDRCSMLHALEVRAPFVDGDLLRFAGTLSQAGLLERPGGWPLRSRGKRLLRDAFACDLPSEVFDRPKRGFAVPISDWFRGPLAGMLRDALFATDSFAADAFDSATIRQMLHAHEHGNADHGQRLYALLMLELWWRQERVCRGLSPTRATQIAAAG